MNRDYLTENLPYDLDLRWKFSKLTSLASEFGANSKEVRKFVRSNRKTPYFGSYYALFLGPGYVPISSFQWDRELEPFVGAALCLTVFGAMVVAIAPLL